MAKFEEQEDPKIKLIARIVTTVIFVVIGLILVFGTFYTVDGGERAVLLTWGKPSTTAIEPGLNVKIPLAQKAVKFDVRTQKYEADASAASKDLQIVSAKIAVNYHVLPDAVPKLYSEVGFNYQERVIQPAVQEAVKASTAKFTAEELIKDRLMVKKEIDDLLTIRLVAKDIVLETTSITNFDFSPEFNKAIEEKQTAVQIALKAENDLITIKVEKQQRITRAEAEAQSIKVVADANAYQVSVQGKAQAEAKLAVAQAEAEALRLQKEQLTPELVQLRMVQAWDGKLPQYQLGSTGMLLQLPTK